MGYGQYSPEFKGKRTKFDLLRSCEHGYESARMWGNNRLFVVYPDRAEYRLHDTAVVTRYSGGELVIDDGGWPTITTTAAINQALAMATGKSCNAYRASFGKMYVRIGAFERTARLPLKVSPGELERATLRSQLVASVTAEADQRVAEARQHGTELDYEATRNHMVALACEAQERFELDELEAYAKGLIKRPRR